MRQRTIKPGFFTNDVLSSLPPLCRLFFVGLWTIADREGRFEDRPARLKAQLLPYDDANAESFLADLAKAGFIVRYEVDGKRYAMLPNFTRHQHPHPKETESFIPPPAEGNVKAVELHGKDMPSREKEVASTAFPSGSSITDNVIPPPPGSTARDPLPPEPKRRDDDGELAEARSALAGALATARQRRPELADLTDQAILDRPEYHAPSGRVRLDSPNAKLLHATAAKLRATKPRKTSAPAWDRPDTSEAGLDAEAAAWIAEHWPEDCDPASRDDLRSLLECLSPPAALAGRIEVQLRFTRYPGLYLDAPSTASADAWIAANWPAEFSVATREDLASELKRRGCPAEQRSAVIAALSARYEFRDAA